MRLLHLTSLYAPHVFGGAERVVQTLAEGQVEAGDTVGVAFLAPSRTASGQLNGVETFPLAHRNPLWIQDSARYPGPVRKLNKVASIYNLLTAHDFANVLDRFRPDILHSHSMAELTPLMWSAARRRGIPIVHTLHDFDLLCIRNTLFKDGQSCDPIHRSCQLLSAIKQSRSSAISQVVGVSRSILDIHLDNGAFQHLPAAARHVIWNPCAAPHVQGARMPRTGPLVFGFLGRLVPEKGIHLLLAACRGLPTQGWHLRVAGRAPAGDADLRELAARLPVTFEGHVDPAGFFAGVDVLVAPTQWSEPFGLTVVEAFAAGVSVLGADLGGVGEIIRAADPAWLVPAGDEQALAARMRSLIEAGRAHPSCRLPDVTVILERTSPARVRALYAGVYEKCAVSGSAAS